MRSSSKENGRFPLLKVLRRPVESAVVTAINVMMTISGVGNDRFGLVAPIVYLGAPGVADRMKGIEAVDSLTPRQMEFPISIETDEKSRRENRALLESFRQRHPTTRLAAVPHPTID